MYFLLLDAELVAKGLLTRTELMMLLRWGNSRRAVFLCHFVGYQINGISGHSFLRWRIPPFVFVVLLNPMVKK
jgi:hypothetical protein